MSDESEPKNLPTPSEVRSGQGSTPGRERGPVEANLRREARVDARIRVSVVRGRRTLPLETSDVSFKGLFLRTDEPPPVRALMRLRVTLPLREIEAHAMAVHVSTTSDAADGRPAGVGVQFWGLAGPDRVAWDDFVRELIQVKRAAAKSAAAKSVVATAETPSPSGIRIGSATEPPPAPPRAASKE
ncbi:MAG: PilZ domain-containing protein [Labilithrix sp.]|nr:PilZ domain-containing protein [Labilithrix sp.]